MSLELPEQQEMENSGGNELALLQALDSDMAALLATAHQGAGGRSKAPGKDKNGKPHLPRLYSISSPRDGERPNTRRLK